VNLRPHRVGKSVNAHAYVFYNHPNLARVPTGKVVDRLPFGFDPFHGMTRLIFVTARINQPEVLAFGYLPAGEGGEHHRQQ